MSCLRSMTSAVALAAVVALTVPTVPAQAQPATKLDEASKQRARKAMYAGRSKMEAGDHEGALAEFRTADEIVAVPSTRLAVAQALEELGRLTEAQQIAASVAEMPKARREPKALVEARKQAAELATELDARIPRLTVVLVDRPKGAAVTATLDGSPTEIDALAAGVALDPGKHQLQVTVGEQSPQTREVVLKPSQRKTVKLALVVREQVPVETESGGISPLLWAGVGVAGAGLVLGGVMGGLALSRSSDLDASCTVGDGDDCPADLRDERDEAVMFSHVSTAGFALAGAGAVLGVVGLLMSGGDSDDEQARVVPLIGPGMVGVGGRF